MTYPDAIKALYDLRLFGLKLGLDNIRRLAQLLDNPHSRLRFIHVAGTNGKGSTCAMLESIYRHAGLRVGLFTSPHLVRFTERIQINRQFIPEPDVVRLLCRLQDLARTFPPDQHLTFFEFVTAMALAWFDEQRCDLVIWETGMGGRLDATNIVSPIATLITNIQYDHQRWLGSSRAEIAAEKAGIIKPLVPILTATDEPDALEVISRTAASQRAPLTIITPADSHNPHLHTSLLGHHQKINAALATATVRALHQLIPVTPSQLRSGLQHVSWPGRLQLLNHPNGRRVLLDGAHNLAGAESLRAAILELFPNTHPTLILGILEDKDWPHVCEVLAPLARHVSCVPVCSERTAPPEALAEACHRSHPSATIRVHPSLGSALAASRNDPFVVIAGSLYLIGQAMELLHVSTAGDPLEPSLNEYAAAIP
jgi:dihydrofolate synthase / folylpolyglutamate synthase